MVPYFRKETIIIVLYYGNHPTLVTFVHKHQSYLLWKPPYIIYICTQRPKLPTYLVTYLTNEFGTALGGEPFDKQLRGGGIERLVGIIVIILLFFLLL